MGRRGRTRGIFWGKMGRVVHPERWVYFNFTADEALKWAVDYIVKKNCRNPQRSERAMEAEVKQESMDGHSLRVVRAGVRQSQFPCRDRFPP